MPEEYEDPPYIAEMRKKREALAEELRKLDAMLAIHDAERLGPYAGKRVIDATVAILREEGPMYRADLVAKLIDGGCSAGTSQPETNISRSLEQNKRLGKLIIDEQGMIRLPEHK